MKYLALFLAVVTAACSELPRSSDDTPLLSALLENHEIAHWKHDAKGAYSIIFDDYCMDGAHGIQDYAAPEADKRGIMFGFGVITSLCNEHEWQRAREMIAAGHEAVNHSHTHRCGIVQDPWCTDEWTDAEVDVEMDLSTRLLKQHTGVQPQFFIFPYDLFTPGKVEHLRSIGYAGARAGKKQALNPPDFTEPFALNFDVKFPPDSLAMQGFGLNEYVDEAIATGQFAFRAFHGVDDESWGALKLQELQEHFDYLQRKQANYQLWVATITDVINYNRARRECRLQGGADEQGVWLRLDSDAGCPEQVALSVILPASSAIDIVSGQGESVPAINGTYTLLTGQSYRVRD